MYFSSIFSESLRNPVKWSDEGYRRAIQSQMVSLTTRSSFADEDILTQNGAVIVMARSSFSKLELGLNTSYRTSLFSSWLIRKTTPSKALCAFNFLPRPCCCITSCGMNFECSLVIGPTLVQTFWKPSLNGFIEAREQPETSRLLPHLYSVHTANPKLYWFCLRNNLVFIAFWVFIISEGYVLLRP